VIESDEGKLVIRTARMLVEAPYVILYEIKPDTQDGPVHTVEIVRVVDGLN
jgi:toxin ParE1/3/4